VLSLELPFPLPREGDRDYHDLHLLGCLVWKATIKRFQLHFQDILFKMHLLDRIIKNTVLYGCMVWGPSLLGVYWARTERVQILLLHRIIRWKTKLSLTTSFWLSLVHIRLETLFFQLVSLLHKLQSLGDSTSRREWYPFLALCSSNLLAFI